MKPKTELEEQIQSLTAQLKDAREKNVKMSEMLGKKQRELAKASVSSAKLKTEIKALKLK